MGAPKVTVQIKSKAPPPKPVKIGGKEAKTITRVPKNFKIVDWERAGRKILIYGDSGMGKTTLASLLDDPIFIGVDDGGGIMHHPITGERLKVIEGIEDYYDVLDVLDSDILESNNNIVTDTITDVGKWMIPWMLDNIPKQGGGKATSIINYGWREGFAHWVDTMSKLLVKYEHWVRKGKNIILLAQSTGHKFNNEGGEDYLKAGPELHHDSQNSVLNMVTAWCDYIFRINYTNISVTKKKASSNQVRAIYTQPRVEFIAKSRGEIFTDYPCVAFENPQDDSVWRLLFNGD